MPDPKSVLFEPNVRIYGPIDDKAVTDFVEQMKAVREGQGGLVLELTTFGGDADAARRIALEIRLFLRHYGRPACCVGKTIVYSAGVTILAAFPKSCRFLTDDAVLLIHERRLQKTIDLDGPIKSSIQIVREQLALLETAERLEMEGFSELVAGSRMTTDELYQRATENCYLTAPEALELGLVQDVLG